MDDFGAWLRRVMRVRQQPDIVHAAPPVDGDVKRAVLNEAINNIDRFTRDYRGLVTLRDELAKLSSLSQAVEETQRNLDSLREQVSREETKLEAIKAEVNRATVAHEMVIESIARVQSERQYE